MKRIGIMFLTGIVIIGAVASWALAQKAAPTSYKTQLEAALGGTIVAVARTTQYPPSSLTQALNFTVDRGAGRTEVVPVQVVLVKSGTGYVVQSMYIVKTSAAMAVQRTTQLPKPEPGVGGGGGGTGTTTDRPNRFEQCIAECYGNAVSTSTDWARKTLCYYACLLGLPMPPK